MKTYRMHRTTFAFVTISGLYLLWASATEGGPLVEPGQTSSMSVESSAEGRSVSPGRFYPVEPRSSGLGSVWPTVWKATAWRATVAVEVMTRHPGSAQGTVSLGSGVIVHSERASRSHRRIWIATSAHVVPRVGGNQIRVELPTAEGRVVRRSARIVRRDREADLALLEARVSPEAQFTVIERGGGGRPARETDKAEVWAVGYPDPTLLPSSPDAASRIERFSVGRAVGASRDFASDYRPYAAGGEQGRLRIRDAFLHTALLVPGASGGPLVDATGTVVGINTGALISRSTGECVRDERLSTGEAGSCLFLASGMDRVWAWVDELAAH